MIEFYENKAKEYILSYLNRSTFIYDNNLNICDIKINEAKILSGLFIYMKCKMNINKNQTEDLLKNMDSKHDKLLQVSIDDKSNSQYYFNYKNAHRWLTKNGEKMLHDSILHNDLSLDIFHKYHWSYPLIYLIFLCISYFVNDQVSQIFIGYFITSLFIIFLGLICYFVHERIHGNKFIDIYRRLPDISYIFTCTPIIIIICLIFFYVYHQIALGYYNVTTIFHVRIWNIVQTLRMFNNISPLLLLCIGFYHLYVKLYKYLIDKYLVDRYSRSSKRTFYIILVIVIISIIFLYMPSTLAIHFKHIINIIIKQSHI